MRILQASLAALFLVSLAPAAELKITLLATTDLHGNLFPYDYYTAQPAARGLAKIATLIEAARAENPTTCSSIAATSSRERRSKRSTKSIKVPYRWIGIQ